MFDIQSKLAERDAFSVALTLDKRQCQIGQVELFQCVELVHTVAVTYSGFVFLHEVSFGILLLKQVVNAHVDFLSSLELPCFEAVC